MLTIGLKMCVKAQIPLGSSRHDVSRRACRAVLFDKLHTAKCTDSTRQTCRVVSRRDATSQVEFGLNLTEVLSRKGRVFRMKIATRIKHTFFTLKRHEIGNTLRDSAQQTRDCFTLQQAARHELQRQQLNAATIRRQNNTCIQVVHNNIA